MKKLTRSLKPSCLDNYQHGTHSWGAVSPSDKQEIWRQFDLMQFGFCAYCECSLTNKHIEHFKDKGTYPRDTFNWDNLFGSCDSNNRCGHFKDSKKATPYNVKDLLKPDVDDANDYLIFLTNGLVTAKADLTPTDKHRAIETIRVFNLNGDITIVNRRKTSLRNIMHNVTTLYEMLDELEEDDWLAFLEDEIDEIKANKVEFQTAMEHAWRFNI